MNFTPCRIYLGVYVFCRVPPKRLVQEESRTPALSLTKHLRNIIELFRNCQLVFSPPFSPQRVSFTGLGLIY